MLVTNMPTRTIMIKPIFSNLRCMKKKMMSVALIDEPKSRRPALGACARPDSLMKIIDIVKTPSTPRIFAYCR